MTRIIINLVIATIVIIPLLTIANEPHLLSLDLFEDSERIAYDWRMKRSLRYQNINEDRVVIIDIDLASMEEIGYWPWRRDRIAEFIQILKEQYNVKLIVMPISFATSSDLSKGILGDLRERFYYDDAIQAAIDQIEPEYNYDLHLLNELDGRPVVLGYEFEATRRQLGHLPNLIELYDEQTGNSIGHSNLRAMSNSWLSYQGYTANDEEFLNLVLGAGYTNFSFDADRNIRRYSLLSRYSGQRFPSLPLVALQFYDNPSQRANILLNMGSGKSFILSDAIESVGASGYSAPIDRSGNMFLNYRSTGGSSGASQFKYVPANQIINNEISTDILRDKVIFIGSSSDVLNDLWNTPVNPRMPGVEIHATAFTNMLDMTALERPINAWLFEGLLLILLGAIMSWFYPKIRVGFSLSFTAIGIAVVYYLNFFHFWLGANEVYRIVPFVTLFVVMMLANLISGLVVEYRQKKKVEGVLNQYIPAELAKEVNASKKGFSMEGEIREMSILFSDVRGFTTISERLKPHELTDLMNQMLTALSRQIHYNRGTIDKYIGDAVMAFWNAPLDDYNHASNAVRGAIGMQAAMAKLSDSLVAKGMPELKMGVGINTGEACVGNMGSEIRLSYTVMGDVVNLASRLEGITKQYGVGIIVGERTRQLSENDFLYRPVDSVRVKGKSQAVHIFEPICETKFAKPSTYQLQDSSLKYWESYQNRRFDDVVSIIQELLKNYPNDNLMQMHLRRANHFLEAPPPDDWEAITTFDTK